MDCVNDLLTRLDRAFEDFEFPLWDCGEQNAVKATMRASGFVAGSGCALVFEDFEHSVKEGFIQSVAYCIATFSITTWIHVGESVLVSVRLSEAGELPFDFGELGVTSRGRRFEVTLNRNELMSAGYLDPDATRPDEVSLLLKISDTLPRDWLFSDPGDLKKLFGMPEDARRLFVVEEWQHPTFEELYEDDLRPSENPDVRAMVEAVCDEDPSPVLLGTPNTSWRVQCGSEHAG